MKLIKLTIENFGPFSYYEIPFAQGEHDCFLLTGKNNEGKSIIILALKLLSSATRAIGHTKLKCTIDGQKFHKLPEIDIEEINIGRLLHNYEGNQGIISGQFDDFSITVILDVSHDLIYADYGGNIKSSVNTFGILPPLGPLAETEEILTLQHIRKHLNTSLAPRHLRNHFAQILSHEEYCMVQDIINASWPSIELLHWEKDKYSERLQCFFKEERIDREISWAGQGLQVWFQIVTHLVRLRNTSIIVLDEPEINLHPEKQNDLIRLLREYHSGSKIIATHSVELMNNVNVNHIIHVQKAKKQPIIKSTKDRAGLDIVRSQIGSNFNLIASQFEAFGCLVFTENASDYKTLYDLASTLRISTSSFNIPIHGFSEYKKAVPFRGAYRLLIGRNIKCSIVLDRDYYPDAYLEEIHKELQDAGIRLVLTPGKEMENIFLSPSTISDILPHDIYKEWLVYWENIFKNERLDCYGSFITLHQKFYPSPTRLDIKTITTMFTPTFEAKWNDPKYRHLFIGGKKALPKLREFYRLRTKKNLTDQMLIDAVVRTNRIQLEDFVKKVFMP